jgi:hypothetical protein
MSEKFKVETGTLLDAYVGLGVDQNRVVKISVSTTSVPVYVSIRESPDENSTNITSIVPPGCCGYFKGHRVVLSGVDGSANGTIDLC